jgi:hypothetical protein
MSNLNTISAQIEKNVVDDEDGWGEPVVFTQRSSGLEFSTRAMCQVLRQEQLNEKSQVYADGMAFLSVFLDVRPVRGDTLYRPSDGRTYVVENLEGVEPYDIFARTNSKHSRSRSGRVEK